MPKRSRRKPLTIGGAVLAVLAGVGFLADWKSLLGKADPTVSSNNQSGGQTAHEIRIGSVFNGGVHYHGTDKKKVELPDIPEALPPNYKRSYTFELNSQRGSKVVFGGGGEVFFELGELAYKNEKTFGNEKVLIQEVKLGGGRRFGLWTPRFGPYPYPRSNVLPLPAFEMRGNVGGKGTAARFDVTGATDIITIVFPMRRDAQFYIEEKGLRLEISVLDISADRLTLNFTVIGPQP